MTLGPAPGNAAGGYGNVRASAADRERAIDVLKAAFAEGRLTTEEHEARAERAYRARTYSDLAALTRRPARRAAGNTAVAGCRCADGLSPGGGVRPD